MTLENLLYNALLRTDPERAHNLGKKGIKWGLFAPGQYKTRESKTKLFGFELNNPLGLAAGFDKNGEIIDEIVEEYGFGWDEIGSITHHGSEGNPKPRIFRLPDGNLLNRMGLNGLPSHKIIEKAGADALTLHSRLAVHGRSVPAEHKWTKKVKDSIGIPLIANGDIFTGQKAEELLDTADGIMIAKGAIGDPQIFQRITKYLKTKKEPPFNPKKNIKLFSQYLELAKKHDLVNIQRIKYIGSNFIKNTKGAAKLRNQFMQLKTFKEINYFVKNQLKTQ